MNMKWFMILVSEYHSILFRTPLCGSHYIYDDCLRTLYIYTLSHDEQSRCASRVHKYVRPRPNAGFPHAAAIEPASLPSWNKSLRHSHGASASWSRTRTLPAVHAQPCPTCERCRSAWMRGERREEWAHTQKTGRVQINPYTEVCYIKLCSWPQKEYEPVRVTSWISVCVQLQCLLGWPTGSTTGDLRMQTVGQMESVGSSDMTTRHWLITLPGF